MCRQLSAWSTLLLPRETIIASRMRADAPLHGKPFLRLYKTICARVPSKRNGNNEYRKQIRSLARTFSIACDLASDSAPFLIRGDFHTFAGRNYYARRSREKEQQRSNNVRKPVVQHFLTRPHPGYFTCEVPFFLFRMKERRQETKCSKKTRVRLNW